MDKLKRLVLEDVVRDGLSVDWLNSLVDAANLILALNVDGSSGLGLTRTSTGLTLRNTAGPFARLAKTGGSTIPATSGSTLGSGTVTLYANLAGTVTSMGVAVTAYNLGTHTVAANTFLILAQVDGFWLVVWENCP